MASPRAAHGVGHRPSEGAGNAGTDGGGDGRARPPVEVHVLGPLGVVVAGRTVDPGPPKQRLLLLSLVAAGARGRTVDQVIDDVWAGDPPRDPRASVHAYVSNLRRLLRPADVRSTDGAAHIRRRDDRYVLDLDEGSGDWLRHDACWRAIAECGDVAADARRIVEIAEAAAALWRGEPLGEADGRPFAVVLATRLRAHRREIDAARTTALLELGATSRAVAVARGMVAADPLDEHARALLVDALGRAEGPARALEAARTARRVLVERFGVEPGRELVVAERRQRRTVAARPVGALGDRPADSIVHHLVGRDLELTDLLGDLAANRAGQPTAVVVVGGAGSGKTTLVDAAASAAARCGDLVVRGTHAPGGTQHPVLAGRAPEVAALELRRAAGSRAVVLAIDDVHLVDRPTGALLSHLAASRGRGRIALVVSSTPPGAASGRAVGRALAGPGARRVGLSDLGPDVVEELVVGVLGESARASAAEVHRRTGGNPLLVIELLRAPGAGVARGWSTSALVPGRVADRFCALPQPVPALLAAGALQGPVFDAGSCAAAIGVPWREALDALDLAVAHGVLVEEPSAAGRLRFRYEVVRDVLVARMAVAGRARAGDAAPVGWAGVAARLAGQRAAAS